MRRSDREIINIEEKISIIQKCKVCRIGLSTNDEPYIVPLNYGYDFTDNKLTLFFHSAVEGKKIEIINKNNNACFEIDCENKLIEGEKACNYSCAFKSIIGFGKIFIIENMDEKIKGLNSIMQHQTDSATVFNFSSENLQKVLVYKMVVGEFTGKQKNVM